MEKQNEKPTRMSTIRTFTLVTLLFICLSTFLSFEVARSIYSSKQVCLCSEKLVNAPVTRNDDETANTAGTNNEDKTTNEDASPINSYVPQTKDGESKTLLVICLHTCQSTYHRIDHLKKTWANHPLIQSQIILIETIVPEPIGKQDDTEVNFRQVVAGCGNDRQSAVCRFQRTYELFIQNHPDVPWMITADDDTWFDIDNLFTYISNLMKIHDPFKELVVKGHANLEKTILYFLHGGCGWLMSNQFLRFKINNHINLNDFLFISRYRQPDTSEAIILRHIFKNISDWDEYYFQGFECKQCPVHSWIDSKFESLPECEIWANRTYGILNKIISFHTIGLGDVNFNIAQQIKTAPDWALFYRENPPQSMYMCKAKDHSLTGYNIASYSYKSLKKREVIYHPSDVHVPIIDFTTYKDEHRPVD